jgi:hypothetical protein
MAPFGNTIRMERCVLVIVTKHAFTGRYFLRENATRRPIDALRPASLRDADRQLCSQGDISQHNPT